MAVERPTCPALPALIIHSVRTSLRACIPVATIRRRSGRRHGIKVVPFPASIEPVTSMISWSHCRLIFEKPPSRVPQVDGNSSPADDRLLPPTVASSTATACLLSGMACRLSFFVQHDRVQSSPILLPQPQRRPVNIIGRNARPTSSSATKAEEQATNPQSITDRPLLCARPQALQSKSEVHDGPSQ